MRGERERLKGGKRSGEGWKGGHGGDIVEEVDALLEKDCGDCED